MAKSPTGKTPSKSSNGKKPVRRIKPEQLRSKAWFDNPANADMTALYIERTMNFGLSREELQSGRPIIGIAQTGSDIAPCNRHHIELASRVRDGIREMGGVPFEFPIHPIQETCKRPTAALDRNRGEAWRQIAEYNAIDDLDALEVGTVLTIPALQTPSE